jgi:hypothetical protein
MVEVWVICIEYFYDIYIAINDLRSEYYCFLMLRVFMIFCRLFFIKIMSEKKYLSYNLLQYNFIKILEYLL